jgi:hypothetical protein
MYKQALMFYFGFAAMASLLLLLTIAYALGAGTVIKTALVVLLAISSLVYGVGSLLEVFAHDRKKN